MRVLKVSNCGMQSSDLASLVPLTKLTTLVAEDCKIAHKSIESLKMMRKNHLKYVTLNGEGLSQEDSEIMKGEVPWVKPIESDNTGSKPGASSGGVRLR